MCANGLARSQDVAGNEQNKNSQIALNCKTLQDIPGQHRNTQSISRHIKAYQRMPQWPHLHIGRIWTGWDHIGVEMRASGWDPILCQGAAGH